MTFIRRMIFIFLLGLALFLAVFFGLKSKEKKVNYSNLDNSVVFCVLG